MAKNRNRHALFAGGKPAPLTAEQIAVKVAASRQCREAFGTWGDVFAHVRVASGKADIASKGRRPPVQPGVPHPALDGARRLTHPDGRVVLLTRSGEELTTEQVKNLLREQK